MVGWRFVSAGCLEILRGSGERVACVRANCLSCVYAASFCTNVCVVSALLTLLASLASCANELPSSLPLSSFYCPHAIAVHLHSASLHVDRVLRTIPSDKRVSVCASTTLTLSPDVALLIASTQKHPLGRSQGASVILSIQYVPDLTEGCRYRPQP